jgi:hypothetical protein
MSGYKMAGMPGYKMACMCTKRNEVLQESALNNP